MLLAYIYYGRRYNFKFNLVVNFTTDIKAIFVTISWIGKLIMGEWIVQSVHESNPKS